MSVNVLQPLQHVSHGGAGSRGPEDALKVKRSGMLLIDLKHLLHMAADGVSNLKEGGSVGKQGVRQHSKTRQGQGFSNHYCHFEVLFLRGLKP